MTSTQERRKHQRFAIEASPAGGRLIPSWRMVDISLGGVAFYYEGPAASPESPREWAKRLFGEDELCLDALPLRTVSDEVIALELASRTPALRRRGVQFGGLTPYQQVMLEYFIWLKTRAG